jgi:hypothetical protein
MITTMKTSTSSTQKLKEKDLTRTLTPTSPTRSKMKRMKLE